jgi:hypothetical protein
MTSEYKAESNRRNAQKSTGPRTDAGKERARMNAVKHGLSAETPVLPDEDAAAFARHRDALLADMSPRGEVELVLAETFVSATWKRQRCERADTGLTTRNMQNADVEEDKQEQLRVISLGRRLFWDAGGDLRFYPHWQNDGEPRTSCVHGPDDPNDPARVIVELESTLAGCRWLLARWAELKERLLPGMTWQPQDKLKAIRLLGKEPLDAPDEPVVCLILLAAHVLHPQHSGAFFELESEFSEFDLERAPYFSRSKDRPYKAVRPGSEAEARQVLTNLVDEATARLERIAAGHEARAAICTGTAAHRLAFDPSDEAERLRRHERACVRDMFRSLKQLLDLRRDGMLSEDGERPHASPPEAGAFSEDSAFLPQQNADLISTSGGDSANQPDASAERQAGGEIGRSLADREPIRRPREERHRPHAPEDPYQPHAPRDPYQPDAREDQRQPDAREEPYQDGARQDGCRPHEDQRQPDAVGDPYPPDAYQHACQPHAPEDRRRPAASQDPNQPDAPAREEQKMQNEPNAASNDEEESADQPNRPAGERDAISAQARLPNWLSVEEVSLAPS